MPCQGVLPIYPLSKAFWRRVGGKGWCAIAIFSYACNFLPRHSRPINAHQPQVTTVRRFNGSTLRSSERLSFKVGLQDGCVPYTVQVLYFVYGAMHCIQLQCSQLCVPVPDARAFCVLFQIFPIAFSIVRQSKSCRGGVQTLKHATCHSSPFYGVPQWVACAMRYVAQLYIVVALAHSITAAAAT